MEPHDRAALVAEVYGEDFVYASPAVWGNVYVDKHDEWMAATADWTFDEIRSVLFQEARDEMFLVAGWPIAGWCACPDHATLIESILVEYGIGFDDDGSPCDLYEDEDLAAAALSGSGCPVWCANLLPSAKYQQVSAMRHL